MCDQSISISDETLPSKKCYTRAITNMVLVCVFARVHVYTYSLLYVTMTFMLCTLYASFIKCYLPAGWSLLPCMDPIAKEYNFEFLIISRSYILADFVMQFHLL